MRYLIRIAVIGFGVLITLIVQLCVIARVFRITGNGDWSPLQLSILVIDAIFLIGAVRVMRKQKRPMALVYILVGDIIVFCYGELIIHFCGYITRS
jgi:hypothetical protein